MNSSIPRVSVIMPTFNQAGFLKQAIESVLHQTYADWELIIIDNFSSDETTEIVKSFSDPRIHYFQFANHGVIATSRNFGARQASGYYLAFLDSDDWWYREKLEITVKKIGDDTLLAHGMRIFRNEQLWSVLSQDIERVHFEQLLYDGNCIATSTVIMKRSAFEAIGGFDENPIGRTAEDYDLWLRLAKSGHHLRVIAQPLTGYRLHNNNNSSRVEVVRKATEYVFEKHIASVSPASLRDIARRKTQYRIGLLEASSYLRSKDRLLAAQKFGHLIRLNPLGWRAWIGLFTVPVPHFLRWEILRILRSVLQRVH